MEWIGGIFFQMTSNMLTDVDDSVEKICTYGETAVKRRYSFYFTIERTNHRYQWRIQDFLDGRCQPKLGGGVRQPNILAIFFRKLHETEQN